MSYNIECESVFEGTDNYLYAHEVGNWLMSLPKGATLEPILKDFGTQRDPELTLTGLRARWSEVR